MNEDETGYRMPPEEITALVDAPPSPVVSLDPNRVWMAVLGQASLPSISDLARPELRLAGLRIDPGSNGASRRADYTEVVLKQISDGTERRIMGVPEGAKMGPVRWSPDGLHLAFSVTDEEEISLWCADVEAAQARRLGDVQLNGVFGTQVSWLPDSSGLICCTVPEDRSAPEGAPTVPSGPVIQETSGKAAPSRTYQDLLKNGYDEELFEYYGTSDVVEVGLDGACRKVGAGGIVCRAEPSSSGEYVLVETIHRPFSYLVPYYRFPFRVEVRDRFGRVVRELADLPLAEDVPVAFDSVPKGPRSFGWRADVPASVFWAEAQAGGDPNQGAEVRDHLYSLSAPFAGEFVLFQALELRFAGLSWGSGDLALVFERWWKTRRIRTWRVKPDVPEAKPAVLFDRSWEDRYKDPGAPILESNAEGRLVLLTEEDGSALFLVGAGASPEGDFPFLDRLELETGQTERLWQCQAPHYERPVKFVDVSKRLLLTYREAVEEQPNVFLRNLKEGSLKQLTAFAHPSPQLAGVQKELIRYKREDGLQLTGTLYLPVGYRTEQGPLPLLMWSYPREFKSADAAGQVKDSQYRFVRVGWGSPLFWLTQGFAVLDGPAMPIVGEGDQEANDTYVEQLVGSAKAAVDEVVRRGVADRDRIAVGGHSYGGFMTANLLAHSDLFRAGVARSGAYNRTLTPFGFQAEERTFWEAPEVYFTMSPFMHADKIKVPLLLIHGEADNNSGTFPMQSERFYNALKGHGATARLAMLPHESHGYRARESVLHMLWEITQWLEQHVKSGTVKK